MSIDEAITHCLEVADGQTAQGKCPECAMEHRQLADWLTDYKRLKERESEESKYKRAFKVACELLNDDYLYGYDRDRIFAEVMQAEGVFSSEDYERFIFEHLDRLSGAEGSGEE